MAEKSTFFNSINGDRKYTAEDMAAHFAKMLTNGVMPAGTQLQVIEGGGMNVTVSAGSAWINGYAYHNDASFVLAIDPADGALNRVDRIVVRWSKLGRSINLTVLKGAPASSATAPDIVRNADYYDLSIATINVDKGITAITQALISDTRMDSDVCGFVSSLIQPDTSGWFVQFETAFNEWFDGVKEALGNDVAGNLQNQINELHTQVREIKTLSGVVPPTASTVGTVGQFYLNTTTKTLYQCVAVDGGVYTWENKSAFKVGDMLTTRRSDLGNDWLLCNGNLIDRAIYPELAEVMGISDNKISTINKSNSNQIICDIKHHDGLWVAVGEGRYSSDYCLRVHVTRNPLRGWTTKDISSLNDYGARLEAIDYADGMWVAIGYFKESIYPRYYTAFTTNPMESWTAVNIAGARAGNLKDIKGYKGTWVAVGSDDDYPEIFITNTAGLGDKWKVVHVSSPMYLKAVECVNGLWVAIGYDDKNYPWVYTTKKPAGTWTARQISTTDPVKIMDIGYHNGLWVICGKHDTSNKPYIYTATDPVNGVWIGHEIDTDTCQLNCISCDENGNWVTAGDKHIYTTQNPKGSWAKAQTQLDLTVNGVVVNDNKYVAVAQNGYSSRTVYAISTGFSILPEIAVDEAYVYVRGK